MQEGRPGLPSLEPRSEPCPTPEEVAGCPGPGASVRGPQSARSSSAAMAAQARTMWGSDVPGFVFLLSCVFSVPPDCRCRVDTTCPAAWIPAPQNVSPRWVNIAFFSPGSRVLSRVLVRLPPSPWPVLQRSQDGPWCPGRLCGPCPCPAPAGAPPTLLSRLQGFCPGRKGAQARTPEPPGSLVPVQPRGPRQTSLVPISLSAQRGQVQRRWPAGVKPQGGGRLRLVQLVHSQGVGCVVTPPGAEARREGDQSCALQRAGMFSAAWGGGPPGSPRLQPLTRPRLRFCRQESREGPADLCLWWCLA